MTAVLVPASDEAAWLQARRAGVTASEIAVLLGLSPYGSPFELYHRKRGTLPAAGPDAAVMERGRVLEPYVAEKFGQLRPEFQVEGTGRELYAHPERPWQMATPDRTLHRRTHDGGYFLRPGAVLECKTDDGSDEWGEEGSGEIPVHYRAQVLWQMDVLGVDRALVACLVVHRWKVRVYELELDDAGRSDLELMRAEAEQFLARVDRGVEPELDWRPATAAALKHLHPGLEDREVTISRTLAGQYRAACTAEKKAKRRKQLAENRIRARLGAGRRVLDTAGQPVLTRQVYDVAEGTRKAYAVDKLVPPRQPRETP